MNGSHDKGPPQMSRKDDVLARMGKAGGPNNTDYQTARAELEVIMAQEYLDLFQKTRENLYEVLAEMSTGIVAFRTVVDHAATESDKTVRLLVRWTKVLGFATIALVVATAALVYVTFKIG